MPNKVGAKGQVVIEKEIRDELGVEPGLRSLSSASSTATSRSTSSHPRTDGRFEASCDRTSTQRFSNALPAWSGARFAKRHGGEQSPNVGVTKVDDE